MENPPLRLIKADNLGAYDIELRPDSRPVIASDGTLLPPAGFSRNRLDALAEIAAQPPLFVDEPTAILSQHLMQKGVSFDQEMGCWQLPLACEYDDKNRARYPQISIPALGISNSLAHRVSFEVFTGRDIPPGFHVDHLCRSHACCNPYHLEPVSPAENTRRGRASRLAAGGLMSFFRSELRPGMTYQEIAELHSRYS